MALRSKASPAQAPAPAAPAPAPAPASSGALELLASKTLDGIFESNRAIAESMQHTAAALAGRSGENDGVATALLEVARGLSAMTSAVQALANRPVEVTLEMPDSPGARSFRVERDDDGRLVGIVEED